MCDKFYELLSLQNIKTNEPKRVSDDNTV